MPELILRISKGMVVLILHRRSAWPVSKRSKKRAQSASCSACPAVCDVSGPGRAWEDKTSLVRKALPQASAEGRSKTDDIGTDASKSTILKHQRLTGEQACSSGSIEVRIRL